MKPVDSKPAIPPKVNQAAFIHKLYSMLEDDSIKHLIAWTPSNTSFVISPGEEFSKVLAQYFKHTNPSSFVRQLNMYGFHKVNDSFNSNNTNNNSNANSNSSANENQWEFKHTSFRRGDVESLRAIKRRTSRTATSNSALPASGHNGSGKVPISVPSTPPPLETPQPSSPFNYTGGFYAPGPIYNSNHDTSLESRLSALEHSLFTLKSTNSLILSRYNMILESSKKSNAEIVMIVDVLLKTTDNSVHQRQLNEIKNALLATKYHNLDDVASIINSCQQPLQEHPSQHPPVITNCIQKSEISYASSRERAPSIFYDPLAPIPNDSAANQPSNAPAASTCNINLASMHRQSVSGTESIFKNSPANSTPGSPGPSDVYHLNSVKNNKINNNNNTISSVNGLGIHHLHPPPPPHFQYPFGNGPSTVLNHLPPTSAPYHYNDSPAWPGRDQPPSRDQRPGSFPFISPLPSRQSSYTGGPLISKDYYYRRHTSGDLIKSIMSMPLQPPATSTMASPPASTASRHNSYASSTSSSDDKPRTVQSLLNPATNSDEAEPDRKRMKM